MSLPFVMAHKKYKSKQKLDIGTWVTRQQLRVVKHEFAFCLLVHYVFHLIN